MKTETQLNTSNKWACQTAANSKTGQASDCNAILTKTTGGMPSWVTGPACCYEWRGTVDPKVAVGEKTKKMIELYKKAGYPVDQTSKAAYRCFSERVLSTLPDVKLTPYGLNATYTPAPGFTLQAVCSGATSLVSAVSVVAMAAYASSF